MSTVKPQPDQDLLQVIHERNVAKQDVLNYPQNRELMLARDAHVMHEDDELEIPPAQGKWLSVSTNQAHTFVYTPLTRELRVELRDGQGTPRVTDFDLDVHGERFVGVSEEGVVYAEVPIDAKQAALKVDGRTFKLSVGKLAPVTTAEGVQSRLINLGYLRKKAPDGQWDAATGEALRAFQEQAGIGVSGRADPPTLKALRKAAGA